MVKSIAILLLAFMPARGQDLIAARRHVYPIMDNFNRADNADLGANWTPVADLVSFAIVGNDVRVSADASDGVEAYTAATWPANQYSQVQITAVSDLAGSGVGAATRIATASGGDFYTSQTSQFDTTMWKRVSSTWTKILTSTTVFSVNDILRMDVIGTRLLLKRNGDIVSGGSFTDSSVTSGSPGISGYEAQAIDAQLDNWQGGVP